MVSASAPGKDLVEDGFKAAGGLVYAWPDAYAKARAADAMLRKRLDTLGLKFDEILSQFVGASATHEGLGGEPSADIAEVMLRVGVRSEEKSRSTGDYMRHYVTTVASLRNLAYVAEYK